MTYRLARAMTAIALLICAASSSARPPDTWDGLVRLKAKQFDNVYLLPHADFRGYTKVMLDPAEFALQKDWLRNFNRNSSMMSGRISDDEARQRLQALRDDFDKVFAKAVERSGYAVVAEPGADVARLSLAVIDLMVTAPDVRSASLARTFSVDAGQATLAVEVRDSLTGQLLGRVVDTREAGSGVPGQRTAASNQADFEQLFVDWARASTRGLDKLKQVSPIDPDGMRKK